jgi:hypothetical protein
MGYFKRGIARRKHDGSNQWQDGYPNPEVINSDIKKGAGYVLTDGKTVIGYCTLFINDEPEYAHIEGKWLSTGDFVVFFASSNKPIRSNYHLRSYSGFKSEDN